MYDLNFHKDPGQAREIAEAHQEEIREEVREHDKADEVEEYEEEQEDNA